MRQQVSPRVTVEGQNILQALLGLLGKKRSTPVQQAPQQQSPQQAIPEAMAQEPSQKSPVNEDLVKQMINIYGGKDAPRYGPNLVKGRKYISEKL